MTMNENSALKAVKALKPAVVIPIHCGIEPRLPLMRTAQTAEGFSKKVVQAGLDTKVVILGSSGQNRDATGDGNEKFTL